MGSIDFHDFIGDSWCVLFSHPADFTPVCTTEFGATAKLEPEWRARGVKVIGLSVDSTRDHARWIADINETQQTRVNFPIIADKDRRVSMLFGMLDTTTFRHGDSLGETMTVRSVFIISPTKRVELIISYPAYIGRSFDEILRVIDALQLSANHRVATPANWRGRRHGGAALHLRRGGRAPVRRTGRLPEGALLLALCARSVASLPMNCR
jgi:alkyl hydroperoxide reductase subunit AhpC